MAKSKPQSKGSQLPQGLPDVLTRFGTTSTAVLNEMSPGDKLDRKVHVKLVRETLSIPLEHMNEMDGLTILSVLLRSRGDFEVVKGPQGGTIKR